ncbi:MAG: acylneuraminate cytidylyltransferase family protein [Desulfamplus sp.]|nr:acylneuraminate cytidylyltransferase family protein [Desulfamplus sp.]
MIQGKRLLAVVTARGGSKRLPRKNLLNLGGKPLIAWSIEAALKSKFIDRTVVSTDDEEIAEVSRHYGAEVPFIRPAELSSDEATSEDTVFHAIDMLVEQGDLFDYVILLQPTSPLRTAKHIDEAVSQLIERNASSVISVCQAEHHPLWCNTLDDNLRMNNFLRPEFNKRSQDLPTYYRLNGAIYLIDIKLLRQYKSLFPQTKSYAYIMTQESSCDVDTHIDYLLAGLLVEKQ